MESDRGHRRSATEDAMLERYRRERGREIISTFRRCCFYGWKQRKEGDRSIDRTLDDDDDDDDDTDNDDDGFEVP